MGFSSHFPQPLKVIVSELCCSVGQDPDTETEVLGALSECSDGVVGPTGSTASTATSVRVCGDDER